MQKREVQYDINSCIRETAPPIDYVVKDKQGAVIFTARLEAPTWSELGALQGAIAAAPKWMGGAMLIAGVIKEWSLQEPITPDAVMRLHRKLQEDLSAAVSDIVNVTAGQLGNSEASSQPNGSQQNSEPTED